MIVIYTMDKCTKCAALKDSIKTMGIDYEERDMSASESIAELMSNGVFALSAPVLQVNDTFFDLPAIFPDVRNPRKISKEVIDTLLSCK